ncbi:MAG: hypothetical protein CUN55_00190 [Phototrophicales bacterium]|nr:MAG: hypothetical protein CUN55_00190 [Phototrophicales bacterium]
MGHTNWVNALALDASGRLFSASRDKTVRVWDTNTFEQFAVFYADAPVLRLLVGEDGLIIVGDESGMVHFLRLVGV